jgi:hypothetical protein
MRQHDSALAAGLWTTDDGRPTTVEPSLFFGGRPSSVDRLSSALRGPAAIPTCRDTDLTALARTGGYRLAVLTSLISVSWSQYDNAVAVGLS